jgi:hypothetical protein
VPAVVASNALLGLRFLLPPLPDSSLPPAPPLCAVGLAICEMVDCVLRTDPDVNVRVFVVAEAFGCVRGTQTRHVHVDDETLERSRNDLIEIAARLAIMKYMLYRQTKIHDQGRDRTIDLT